MNENEEREYRQMQGEYLGRMASLEHMLTEYLLEYVHVENRREEFDKWFIEAPIPFNHKVALFKRLEGENPLMEVNFPEIWKDLYQLQRFRNTLAHSFVGFSGMMTARGKRVPAKQASIKSLSKNLEKLRRWENIILNMYADMIQGVIPPVSADDYADWPL